MNDRRVILLVLITAILAAAFTAGSWTAPHVPTLLFWAAVSIAAELMWIRLPVGEATLSMASCSQFAMVLMLPRGHAMAIAAITGALSEALYLRKSPSRVIFNASQTALAVGVASWLFSVSGGASARLLELVAHGRMLPIGLAAIAYFAVNTGAVSLAVGLSERISPLAAWRKNFGYRYELLASAALLSLGAMLASHYAATGIPGTVLVAFPVVLAYQGYRKVTARRSTQEPESAERRAA